MFLLEKILTLEMDFAFHPMIMPKLPFVDLQNANILPTIMAFHTALLLIKELTSRQKKYNKGPTLMEFTGLTMLGILQQLV